MDNSLIDLQKEDANNNIIDSLNSNEISILEESETSFIEEKKENSEK